MPGDLRCGDRAILLGGGAADFAGEIVLRPCLELLSAATVSPGLPGKKRQEDPKKERKKKEQKKKGNGPMGAKRHRQ